MRREPLETLRLYLWLAGTHFLISMVTFGGGYIVLPMIRKAFVEKKKLMKHQDLLDLAAIAQSSPGAIAVNLASLSGYSVAGMGGALVSGIACVLPPLILLSVVTVFYSALRDNVIVSAVLRGMQIGVAAVMADMVLDLCAAICKEKRLLYILLLPLAFAAHFFLNLPVALILIGCAGVCICREGWGRRC